MTEDFEALLQRGVDEGRVSTEDAQDAHERYLRWIEGGPIEFLMKQADVHPQQGRLFE